MKTVYLWFLLLISACGVSERTELLNVVKVIDGDTIIVRDSSGNDVHVRLIGINSPEPRDFKHRKKEPMGKEASAFANKLMQSGLVRLEFDVERHDKYGRTLAYVFTDKGVFVNDSMVKAGFAEVMTFPPNVKHTDRLVQSQLLARKEKRGIWSIE